MSRKDTTLYAYWSKREKDVLYCYPGSKADGHLLHQYLSPGLGLKGSKPDLFTELEARGYDLTTFRLSIKKKKQEPAV